MCMRRVHLSMRTEGIKAFQNGYSVLVWMDENDMKRISVDANLFIWKRISVDGTLSFLQGAWVGA